MYSEIGVSTISNELLEYAKNTVDDWAVDLSFNVKQVPKELYLKDKFFQDLSLKFNYVVGIFKLNPFTCYKWHTDKHRGVVINMLLTPDARSNCIFETSKIDSQYSNIIELKYKPNTYYLLDAQIPHEVTNYEDTRYLLSIRFLAEKTQLRYNDALAVLK